jgi:hypothetical protein
VAIFPFLGSQNDKRRVEELHAIGLLLCLHSFHVALPMTIQDLLALMPFRVPLEGGPRKLFETRPNYRLSDAHTACVFPTLELEPPVGKTQGSRCTF